MAFVSLAIIFGTLIVCDTLRGFLTKCQHSIFLNLLVDVIISVEFVTVAFELGVILENYGLLIWLIGLYLNVLYQLLRWRGLTMPSPCVHFIGFLSGEFTLKEVLLRTAVTLLAGFATYHFYVAPIWSLELTSMHVGKLESSSRESCTVPFSDVPLWKSMSAEFLGSVFLGIAPGLVMEHPVLANNDPVYTALVIGALVCAAIVPMLAISGGMFNPLLASVLFAGCEGHSMLEHILVYWLGAFGGSLVSFFTYPAVKKMVYPITASKKKN